MLSHAPLACLLLFVVELLRPSPGLACRCKTLPRRARARACRSVSAFSLSFASSSGPRTRSAAERAAPGSRDAVLVERAARRGAQSRTADEKAVHGLRDGPPPAHGVRGSCCRTWRPPVHSGKRPTRPRLCGVKAPGACLCPALRLLQSSKMKTEDGKPQFKGKGEPCTTPWRARSAPQKIGVCDNPRPVPKSRVASAARGPPCPNLAGLVHWGLDGCVGGHWEPVCGRVASACWVPVGAAGPGALGVKRGVGATSPPSLSCRRLEPVLADQDDCVAQPRERARTRRGAVRPTRPASRCNARAPPTAGLLASALARRPPQLLRRTRPSPTTRPSTSSSARSCTGRSQRPTLPRPHHRRPPSRQPAPHRYLALVSRGKSLPTTCSGHAARSPPLRCFNRCAAPRVTWGLLPARAARRGRRRRRRRQLAAAR